ncbi:hypothetical protein HYD91_00850 [Mycoplasmopsis bovis]|nr:hypothetical protein [Mycoplasmopsis bovis]QQH35582.1 hypothetical protein HYD91_00850 [Mycoplasmopsis bovis]
MLELKDILKWTAFSSMSSMDIYVNIWNDWLKKYELENEIVNQCKKQIDRNLAKTHLELLVLFGLNLMEINQDMN